MKVLLTVVVAGLVLGVATPAQATTPARSCYGWKAWATVPHEVRFTADRVRARGSSCVNARVVVRAFLLAEGKNPDCAADAALAGRACAVSGWTCETRGRASCSKGQTLITFRHVRVTELRR